MFKWYILHHHTSLHHHQYASYMVPICFLYGSYDNLQASPESHLWAPGRRIEIAVRRPRSDQIKQQMLTGFRLMDFMILRCNDGKKWWFNEKHDGYCVLTMGLMMVWWWIWWCVEMDSLVINHPTGSLWRFMAVALRLAEQKHKNSWFFLPETSRRVVYRTRVFNVCSVRHWFHTTNHSGFASLSKFNFLKKYARTFHWICKKPQRHSLFFCAKCSSQFLQWAWRGFCGNCFPISTAKREHASKSCHWARLT